MKATASQAAKAGKSSAAKPVARPAKAATGARAAATKAPGKAATTAKAAGKPAAKPATKAAAKPAAKPAARPAAKPAAKASPAPKAAAPKAAAPKAAARPAAKPAPKATARPAAKPAAKAAPASRSPAERAATVAHALIHKVAAAPAPAAPAPRATSKRDARRAAIDNITRAEVTPTHSPDAAKATYSQTIPRNAMTPPVPTSLQKDPKRANNWKTLPVDQLTDQDVLAMPDSEYMNDQQLAFFRLKLQRLKADMLANAGETTEHLREDTVVVPDPADRATIEEEHALELRTRDRERKLLKKIEQAIVRIDAGDYGYCEETGEPIGVGRLMARPTASLSLEAQQRRELKQKMFGD